MQAAEAELQAARGQVSASLEEVQRLSQDLGLAADLHSEVWRRISINDISQIAVA